MQTSNFSKKWIWFIAITSVFAALLLVPSVFKLLFALGFLNAEEEKFLWCVSGGVLLLSCVVCYVLKTTKSQWSSLLFMSALVLLFSEFATRAAIKLFASEETKDQLIRKADMSYGLGIAFEGHPFTQFTGKGGEALKGTKAFGNLPPYNNYGFPDVDFERDKPQNVIRIACIGESTTADGYPTYLEEVLNKNRTQLNARYETMCFAQPMWTTLHTMIAFVSTVIDFKPDYLIIHHGWNEGKVRNCLPGEFRTDYSHHFKSFEKPEAFDAELIRASVIYRLIKFQYDKTPQWMKMETAIEKERKQMAFTFSDTIELYPYKRNLETIITMAGVYGIKTVITTLPHSTDSAIEFYYSVPNIEQCNAINRTLASKYANEILFCDLDSAITGKYNPLFIDLGHVEEEGLLLKANLLAPVILQDAQSKETGMSDLSKEVCRQIHLKRISQRLLHNHQWVNENISAKAGTTISIEAKALERAKELFLTDSLKHL